MKFLFRYSVLFFALITNQHLNQSELISSLVAQFSRKRKTARAEAEHREFAGVTDGKP